MTEDKKFVENLVYKNCYKFLETPVIVTSGESITPFFLSGENVIGSRASEYRAHEMNPVAMYNWVKEQLVSSPDFKKAMNYVKEQVDLSDVDFISGGRTRDWPFAAALSILTQKDTLFLYKPEDGVEPMILGTNGDIYVTKFLKDVIVFHIVDLVTTASSIVNSGGWINQIRQLGANINQVYSMIDRNQGATQILGERGVALNSAVQIDSNWLDEHDHKNTYTITKYLEDPREWSMDYLSTYGLDCILPYLNPNTPQAKKDNRLLKFIAANEKKLEQRGLLDLLYSHGRTDSFRAVADSERGVEWGETFETAIVKYMN